MKNIFIPTYYFSLVNIHVSNINLIFIMYTVFVSFQYKIIKNKIVMLIVNTNKSFSVYFFISYSLTHSDIQME